MRELDRRRLKRDIKDDMDSLGLSQKVALFRNKSGGESRGQPDSHGSPRKMTVKKCVAIGL